MKRLFVFFFSCALWGCDQETVSPTPPDVSAPVEAPRIVTVPGNITETVFALGMGENIVGACASSRYPDAVEDIPKVGYRTNLNAEGVLSLSPNMVIATAEAGPEEVINQIRDAGIRVEIVAGERTFDGAVNRITEVAELLGKQAEGQTLIGKMRTDIADAVKPPAEGEQRPKVLFIYVARNTSMVAGSGTGADAMIQLAGGVNAVTSFQQFKPINPEAIVEANPDFILLDNSGLKAVGGVEGALKLPGVSETTAGKNRQIIALDKTLLLGFGPRLTEGATQLARLIQK